MKEQNCSLIVVLNGYNVLSNERAGLNPLLEALGHFKHDSNLEILVMVILNMDAHPPCHLQLSPSPSRSNSVFCCIGDVPKLKQATMAFNGVLLNDHVASMHREIGERRMAFSTIFTPYHTACKNKGVRLYTHKRVLQYNAVIY